MIARISTLFFILISVNAHAEGSGYQQYSRGVELAAQGKCKEAVEKFQGAIKLTPSFTSSYVDLARCQVLLGSRAAGLESLLLGIEKAKRDDDRQRLRKELASLSEVFYTNDVFQKYQSGLNYLRLSRFSAAAEELTAAQEKEPENMLVLLALAKSLKLDGRAARAKELLLQAVHWNPGKTEAVEDLSAMIWEEQPEQVLKLLEPLQKGKNSSELGLTFYALALTKMKRSKEGLELLRNAVEDNNNWVQSAYWLGKAFSEEANGNWMARKYLMTFQRRVDGVFQNQKNLFPYELEEFKALKKQADALLVRVNQALQ